MGATHRTKSTKWRAVRWVIALLIIMFVFVSVWIGVRATMARDALLGAVPIATRIGSQVLAEGSDIQGDLQELQERAQTAASLTSDPIWKSIEVVPGIGVNLAAFRQSASIIDQLATEALPPVSKLADSFDTAALAPVGGAIDLQVFVDAQPMLGEARAALEEANLAAQEIDTASTIPQIGSAVDQVTSLVTRAKSVVDGLDTAASLLPPMLGIDGPRDYLLLSLNNAELRSTGGLPGAIAVVHAEQGQLSLGQLSSATALGQFADPVLPLSEAESTLYGEALGTWMHDVNYTPNFPRSGELARAMWLDRTGQSVDGVITIDPIALGYILKATGPVGPVNGVTLDKSNAAEFLLNDVYSQFAEPSQQDAFFAQVTSLVFAALIDGNTNGETLLTALGDASSENRIHVWSSNSDEQAQLSRTPLAGIVPESTDKDTAFGVYFNDATGAKMDYYVQGAIAIASAVCRNDQRPNFEVKVQLSSRAPHDAATSLPSYVTGGGSYGVAPGNVSTNVFVYAPSGSVPYSVSIDGQEYAFVAADHDGHSVAGVNVELAPAESSTISMKFVGEAGAAKAVTLQHTPMASDVETSVDNYLDCSDVAPAPTEQDAEQTEAFSSDSGISLTLSRGTQTK